MAGRPLVWHTLAAWVQVPELRRTVVVVAPDDTHWRIADPEAGSDRPRFRGGTLSVPGSAPPLPSERLCVVPCGGASRAQSVFNGLHALLQRGAARHDWVLVHDAARCLITPGDVQRLIAACRDDEVGGLLAQPLPDTLKQAQGDRVAATLMRSDKWLAQTPQMARIGQLIEALEAGGEGMTDEASALEAQGLRPRLVRGAAYNFKVTYPDDWALAEAVLRQRAESGALQPC